MYLPYGMLTLLLYGSTTMTITQSLVGCLTQGIDTQGRYRFFHSYGWWR